MPIPPLESDGFLPSGIYSATLAEVTAQFGGGSERRESQGRLLTAVVQAAKKYPQTKRVLVWGSFVTDTSEPGDLDYSLVVGVDFQVATLREEDRRFFVPFLARQYYGADTGFVLLSDWPIESYATRLDFICHRRAGQGTRGIIEISLRGEIPNDTAE